MLGMQSFSPRIKVQPTISLNSAYSAGNVVGGIMAIPHPFNNTKTGLLKTVTVKDQNNQSAVLAILLFDQKPTGTYADKVAFTWTAADFAFLIGVVNVAAADYTAVNNKAIADEDVSKVVGDNTPSDTSSDTTNLYAIAVLVSGTPTWTSAGNLEFQFGFLQD